MVLTIVRDNTERRYTTGTAGAAAQRFASCGPMWTRLQDLRNLPAGHPTVTVMTWNAGAERIKGYAADDDCGSAIFRASLFRKDAAQGPPRSWLRLAAPAPN